VRRQVRRRLEPTCRRPCAEGLLGHAHWKNRTADPGRPRTPRPWHFFPDPSQSMICYTQGRTVSRQEAYMLRGSCLCGGIVFEIAGEVPGIGQCHCSLCRKVSGVGSAAAIAISADRLKWISGQDLLQGFQRPSGYGTSFCRVCGSPAPPSARSTTTRGPTSSSTSMSAPRRRGRSSATKHRNTREMGRPGVLLSAKRGRKSKAAAHEKIGKIVTCPRILILEFWNLEF
jgi:hypothetical protein